MSITVSNIKIVSTNLSGQNGNGSSYFPNFSPDGTKISFASNADNLVAGDNNGKTDVFVKDLISGGVTRISTIGSTEGDGNSSTPYFSPDGTKIAFTSLSQNFATGDANNSRDIFVKDLTTGDLIFVSADINGTSPYGSSKHPSWSADSKHIAFDSTANTLIPGGSPEDASLEGPNVFIKNIETKEVKLVTPFNMWSSTPVFSPDGTKLAFDHGSNLPFLGDMNNARDIFLKDLIADKYSLVSTDSNGNQGNGPTPNNPDTVFSPDGTKVVFTSWATNLIANDTNDKQDIFLKNLLSGKTTAISTDASGNVGNDHSNGPVFSPDGIHIAFTSSASNLVSGDGNGVSDLFIKNIVTGEITRVLENVVSPVVSFSPDGSKLAATQGSSIFVLSLDFLDMHIGTEDGERISGGNKDEIIYGEGGDDTLKGKNGDDLLCGGTGNDTLWGNNGDDILKGGEGSDWMKGGNGNDIFILDVLDGHVDTIADMRTHDQIDLTRILQNAEGFTRDNAFSDGFVSLQQDGQDVGLYIDLDGSDGEETETLLAMLLNVEADDFGPENFILPIAGTIAQPPEEPKDNLPPVSEEGTASDNTLIGTEDEDTLKGREGNDFLFGKGGEDTLWGNDGDDTLYGGQSSDWIKGGDGADKFILSATDEGTDEIYDLRLSSGDSIEIRDILSFDPLSDDIANFVQITQSSGDSILSVDIDGATNGQDFVQITEIYGITGLDAGQLYNDGDLLIQNGVV